ncbi:hypothetical protein GCM10010428_50280 [Actinosynnema pretiosum subsp. pretiosum]
MKSAAALALASAALLAGAGTASAGNQSYPVSSWLDVNVRTCASTFCKPVGVAEVGYTTYATCWTRGELIIEHGITNDVWLQVGSTDTGVWGYASAVYFRGDELANLPATAQCRV